MPNTNRNQTVYIPTGNPDTVNVSELYKGGELGLAFDANDRSYQIVQVDSGVVAANPVGVVAANQLAFWKDQDKYLVTNDSRVALGHPSASSPNGAFRQFVAGVFRNAVTSGYYTNILQRGDYIPTVSASAGNDVGDQLVAANANTAATDVVASGTAPTVKVIGRVRSAGTGTLIYGDIDIPNIP